MKNWSIKRKLAFLCSSLLIMIVLVGGLGMALNLMAMRQIDLVENVQVPAVRSMGLADMYHDGLRAIVLRAITSADAQERAEVAEELAEMTKDLAEQMEILRKLNIAPEVKSKIVNEAGPAVEAYAKASKEIAGMALAGNKDAALARMPEFQAAFKKLEGVLEKLGHRLSNETAVL